VGEIFENFEMGREQILIFVSIRLHCLSSRAIIVIQLKSKLFYIEDKAG
jgi:hypothetical protein